MKIWKFVAVVALLCGAWAQCRAEVVAEESFDNDISEYLLKNATLQQVSLKKIEGFTTGETSLVGDFSKSKERWPIFVKYPKSGGMNFGRKIVKISFDYKVVSTNGKTLCVALIQRSAKKRTINDDVKYFGAKAGETGHLELMSVPMPADVPPPVFLLSAKTSQAIIAIDNLKIETLDAPQWLFEKDIGIWGMKVSLFSSGFLPNNPQLLSLTKEQFFPFIDRYGQFIHKNWRNKVHSDADLKKRTEEENAYYKNIPDIPDSDDFMGRVLPGRKFEATGRFRTQKVDGKWFFITPQGNLFWSFGVNTVGMYAPTCVSERENYFADAFDPKYTSRSNQIRHLYKKPYNVFHFEHRNMELKYGANWRSLYGEIVGKRARKWGVNTLGCWTQGFVFKKAKVPYTASVSLPIQCRIKTKGYLSQYWQDAPDYFDPQLEANSIERVKKLKEYIDDPYCLGVFVDNELPWQSKTLVLPKALLQSPADQPAKIKFREMLREKYKDIDALNKAWNAPYKDFDDFLRRDSFVPATKAAEADMLAFEEKFYDAYFRICKNAIKTVSPDTLYISCRFAWKNELVCKAATRYADVVAYNWYKDDASKLAHPEDSLDKPIIIGEYHFGNQDAGVFGGGLRPRATMKDRIKANNKYVKSALKNPSIVGVHWFRWSDQVASGRSGDGENYCVGMVDICDTPVYEFTDSLRNLAEKLYAVRLKANQKNGK